MEAKTPTKFPLQGELITLLKTLLPLHSVYVIGINTDKKTENTYLPPQRATCQKKIIYTLLIITYKPISKRLGDLMDDVYNKMERRCKTYIITNTLSKVKERLDYGSNFLQQAIFRTPCIYKTDDSLLGFSNYSLLVHRKVYQRIERTWKGRMDRAEYLLSILDTMEPKEDSVSRLAIMHYALEQVCMALLYVFWEFKPQHYALSYLLDLCSHFTQLPQTIFPKETFGLHRMHYMLCNAQHIMRFKVQNEFSEEDTEKAYNRCELFYGEARDLGERKLSQLKELHCELAKP